MTSIIQWSETNECELFLCKSFPTLVPAWNEKILACRTQRNTRWKSFLQGHKGHNKEDDSISWESPHRNHYKMWFFIFITKLYGWSNSSYLNGGLRVIKVRNRQSYNSTIIKSKLLQNLKVLTSVHRTAGRDTISVNCDALKIKLSLFITTRCR